MRRAHYPARVAFGLLTLSALAALPPGLHAQSTLTCETCHGELELLRQHVSTLEEAQEAHVPAAMVEASAHTGMACAECHDGYSSFPHEDLGRTEACADCHDDQRDAWDEGIHGIDGNAECTSCHGIHDVLTAQQMREPGGVAVLQAACASCHFEPRTPPDDPHASSESCAACHAPHRTLSPGNPESNVHPLNQAETCGTCHDTVAVAWRADVHGTAVPHLASPEGAQALPEVDAHLEPPACTGCHGAHGMITPESEDFLFEMTERCSHCHEEFAHSFADSYHGQATELRSEKAATCHHCHGSHDVLPSTEAASMVSEANLLETCQACHPDATEGFTAFQPHADHNDRENYPLAYWSYHLMTLLLISTFTFFGVHTALWMVRLGIDALRGESGHAPPAGE